MTTKSAQEVYLLTGLEEPGHLYIKDTLKPSLEFSAVTVLAPGSPVEYRVMRDEDGVCACTQGVNAVGDGPLAVYAVVTAPPAAEAVTVIVRGFAPFTDVAVAS